MPTLKNHPLSPRQRDILLRLSQGETYKDIMAAMKMKDYNLHSHLHIIRQKTGIRDTRNRAEVKAWYRSYSPEPRHWGPTPRQREVLELYAAGQSHRTIARALGLSPQTVAVTAAAGAKRLGVTSSNHFDRMAQIRAGLERLKASGGNVDPMNDPAFF